MSENKETYFDKNMKELLTKIRDKEKDITKQFLATPYRKELVEVIKLLVAIEKNLIDSFSNANEIMCHKKVTQLSGHDVLLAIQDEASNRKIAGIVLNNIQLITNPKNISTSCYVIEELKNLVEEKDISKKGNDVKKLQENMESIALLDKIENISAELSSSVRLSI